MKRKQIDDFINYLKDQFPGCIEDHFTYKMIESIIDYAYRNHGHTKGSARAIVVDMIPELDYQEAERFLPDFDEWEPNT